MQSKVILVTDLILVIVPTVIFYFGEFHGSQWGNGLERFWLSLFQAVTPRTAGFNTADFGQMSEGGLFFPKVRTPVRKDKCHVDLVWW